jgi:hypothetical protein
MAPLARNGRTNVPVFPGSNVSSGDPKAFDRIHRHSRPAEIAAVLESLAVIIAAARGDQSPAIGDSAQIALDPRIILSIVNLETHQTHGD